MNSNPLSVTVWWTPDCGYLHCETDPEWISFQCPDHVSLEDDGSTHDELVP